MLAKCLMLIYYLLFKWILREGTNAKCFLALSFFFYSVSILNSIQFQLISFRRFGLSHRNVCFQFHQPEKKWENPLHQRHSTISSAVVMPYPTFCHHIIVVPPRSHMIKYYIINGKIKLWALSMWHIMSLMWCIILLNNIKWKMYTQALNWSPGSAEESERYMKNANALTTYAFDTEPYRFIMRSVRSRLLLFSLYFPNWPHTHMRCQCSVFNKHHTVLCVAPREWKFKSDSLSCFWLNIHSLCLTMTSSIYGACK